MTIPSYDNRRSYTGDGSTTAFAFPPPFTANTDLMVQIRAADGTTTTQALGADYAVAGAGSPAGGSVTMTAAPATGTTLIIYRDVPLTQSVDLQDGGPLPAPTINRALDRITMWGQRLKEQIAALGILATQTAAGLMSSADKVKLDGIQPGAQANTVTSVNGYTGTIVLAKGDVGLGNADNTPDANKPVSTAQQAALDAKLTRAGNLSDLTNAAAARSNLGGGATGISVFQAANISTALTSIGATTIGSSLVTAANAGAARSILGLVPGTDVQAYSARLAEIAGSVWAQGDILYFNGASLARLPAGTAGQFFRTGGPSGTPDWATISGGGDMLRANNLSDIANAATARSNIGAVGGPAVANDGEAVIFDGTTGKLVKSGGAQWVRSGDSLTFTANVAGGNKIEVSNPSTALNSSAQYAWSTGRANVSAIAILENTGASGGQLRLAGAPNVNDLIIDYNTIWFRNTAGILAGKIDAGGVDLVSGLNYRINGSPLAFSNLAGSAAASQGGTGQTTYTTGDLLYASGPASLSKLIDVATGNALLSGGVGAAPSWGKIGLTTHTTGTLAIANGGTNITTYATGDILYAGAANTLSKLAIGSTGQVLSITGGMPAWTSNNTTWPPGTIYGLTLSQASTTTIGIAAGGCANEDGGTAYNIVIGSALTKGLGAWAAGTGSGGLDTGSIAASTWYHVHLIRKDSDGTIDALLSLSAIAPTMPASYTARRRIGAIKTNGSAQITPFIQVGDQFLWDMPIADSSSTVSSTSAQLVALSVPPSINAEAEIEFSAESTTFGYVLVSSSLTSDQAPSSTATPYFTVIAASAGSRGYARLRIRTNGSGQIRHRNTSSASTTIIIITHSWIDTRGRM